MLIVLWKMLVRGMRWAAAFLREQMQAMYGSIPVDFDEQVVEVVSGVRRKSPVAKRYLQALRERRLNRKWR